MAESSWTFETPGGAALRVEVPAGAVTVETWPTPRVEIEVSAADDRSAAAVAEMQVTARERGGRHEITVGAPRGEGWLGLGLRGGRTPDLRVAIRCPEDAELELTTQSADLQAHGRLGDVSVKSASGDAVLEDAASVAFTSAGGDLRAATVGGTLVSRSASGDVDVRSVGGTGSVTTVSGDVRIGGTAAAVAVKTVSGDVDVEAAGGSVVVGTVSGDVGIAARPGLVLAVDARSMSGRLTSELEVEDRPAEDGEKAVDLRVRTVSGDVRIARSAAVAG